MADSTFSFALDDSQAAGASESLANNLQSLRAQILEDTAALGQMQKALRQMRGSAGVSTEAFGRLQKQIAAQKSRIAGAQASYVSMGGTFERIKSPANETSRRFGDLAVGGERLQDVMGLAGGSMGRLGTAAAAVTGPVGLTIAAVAALTAGLVALTAAAAKAVTTIARFGTQAALAHRKERIELEGLTESYHGLFGIWGKVGGNADQIQASIDTVSNSVALGRDQIRGYASSLARLRVRGEALTGALEAISIVASVQGEQQAQLFRSMLLHSAAAGEGIGEMVDDVKARLGGLAQQQMLDLNVQAEKMRENLGRLFVGLKFGPLLEAVSGITEMFSQSTFEGKALKQIVEVVFQPMIDAVASLGPSVKRFFQGVILGTQDVIIAVLRVAVAFKNAFGFPELSANFDTTQAGITAVKVVLVGLVGVVAAATTAVAGFAATLGGPVIAAFALGSAAFSRLKSILEGIDWSELGKSVVEGIADGIRNNVTLPLEAIKDLGLNLKDAFTSVIEARSPSRLFARVAAPIPQGVTKTLDAETPTVQRAIQHMITPPAGGLKLNPAGGPTIAPARPVAAPNQTTNNTRSVNLTVEGGLHVHAEDTGGDPEAVGRSVLDAIAGQLEGVELMLGAQT